MSRQLTTLQWSELEDAHTHLGLILSNSNRTVTDSQWAQLEYMAAHFAGIVTPSPSPHLLPSTTVLP